MSDWVLSFMLFQTAEINNHIAMILFIWFICAMISIPDISVIVSHYIYVSFVL